MRMKGLAQARQQIEALQKRVDERIDGLDQDDPKWDAKDEFWSHVWMEFDAALTALNNLKDMRIEDYTG